MSFARRSYWIIIIACSILLSGFSPVWAESARPKRSSDRTQPPSQPNGFVCGTYPDRIVDELLFHKMQRARRTQLQRALAPARTYVANNLVVIEDDGSIVTEPFRNVFDLDGRRLHFVPNNSGGYDITSLPPAFDTNFGTNLNAGDDTNHRIAFTTGFSFPFFGTGWDHVWVRSNANVTFGSTGNPDFYDPNDFFLELPMIAALFADLNPAQSGRVLYRQAADRFVVTWDRLPEFDTSNSNTVQLTLFVDGSFDIAYNSVAIRLAINNLPIVAGFNSGQPGAEAAQVNLSNLPITGSNASVVFEVFQEVVARDVNVVAVAQRFYDVQPDSFEQLVMITDFDLLNDFLFAFHLGVQNEVSGLGINIFNNSSALGSAGRLKSFLHMNHIDAWSEEPAGLSFVNVLGQEAEHAWGAFVNYGRAGQGSDLILGRSLAHWSFYFETEGSVMEGNSWRDNGNGTFTTVKSFDNYSLLDHYLMGLRPPEEVKPLFLLEVPGVTLEQRSRFPELGVTVTATKQPVLIDDIVAVEGPRLPSAQDAPHVFRQAFIYLLRQGTQATQQHLDKAERFRTSWVDYYADRTDGRGIMQTQLGAELSVANVEGNVTSALDGSVVQDLEAKLLEKNFVQPIYDGGHYAFRVLASSLTPGNMSATIALHAYPFLPDMSTVNLTFGSTLLHHRALTPLAQSALRGSVRDGNGQGVKATATLFVSSETVDDFTLTASTDAAGNFVFENIYISFPGLVSYDQLLIEPEIPFVEKSLTNITVNAGTPTVFEVTVEPADVLLVNDDPNRQFQEFYTTAFESLGLKAYLWPQAQRGTVPVSRGTLLKRNLIIWYTGNATPAQALTAAERDSIAAYLDAGGGLFLTGQNIAEGLAGTDFLASRLHVSFVRNLSDPIAHGVRGDPVGTGLINIATAGVGGANNQNSRDLLEPDGFANKVIVYDTTTGTTAGVRVENTSNRSRLVFFGFGFESIAARANFASREQVLHNVLDRLSGTVGVAEREHENLPQVFHLSASYPNPLHAAAREAETVIRYQLPAQAVGEHVTLTIFDVLGREVRTLVDEAYRPGHFSARWDGRDREGRLATSGVYFYKLSAGSMSQVRKLMLVR
ncbi:MAG: FlgD immunoglobulin-like domain containing protein [bacterium]